MIIVPKGHHNYSLFIFLYSLQYRQAEGSGEVRVILLHGKASFHGLHDLFASAQADLGALNQVQIFADRVGEADGKHALLQLGEEYHRLGLVRVFFQVGHQIVQDPLQVERIGEDAALALKILPLDAKARVAQVKLRLAQQLLQQQPPP